jgi:hypothetical protein
MLKVVVAVVVVVVVVVQLEIVQLQVVLEVVVGVLQRQVREEAVALVNDVFLDFVFACLRTFLLCTLFSISRCVGLLLIRINIASN